MCNYRVMNLRNNVGFDKDTILSSRAEIYRNSQKSIHSMAQYNPVFLLDMQVGYHVNLINTTVLS